jgi:hypothetical protein
MKWLGQFAHAAVLVALVAGFLVYVESADSQQESRDALIAPACWADPQQVIEDGRQPLPLRNCAPSPHPGRDPISQPCPVPIPDPGGDLPDTGASDLRLSRRTGGG